MNMDPVYRYMMPYPYPRDHMDYRPNHYPISPAAPSHMYMTPTRPPVNYEHWPWGSNYSYPYPPVGCHGCCNHSHMPAHYSWRPPYSHVPPAYAPGAYPPYPGEYVPPYYHMEQPQFAYEKNIPRDHHCYGCPNHLCSRKEQKKIEEEEPERELNNDATLAPFKFKNSPYPLMWLPVDSGNDSEHQKDQKDGSVNVKPPHVDRKTDQKRSGAWFGWYPYESNVRTGNNEGNMLSADTKVEKSGPAKEQEEKRTSSHDSDDGKGQLPFPVFWMPYMPEEKGKEESKENNVTNSKPSVEPVKDSGQQTGGSALSKVKVVPVQEVKPHKESATSQRKEGRRHSSSGDGNGTTEKLAKDDQKREPSSPPKSSKLPPVCLRVDPLPRRKNTNGKLRSPSPTHGKQKPDQLSNGPRKVLSSINHEEKKPDQVTSKEGNGTIKAIKFVDGSTSQDVLPESQIEVEPMKENVSIECSKSGEAVRPENTLSAGGDKGNVSTDKDVVAHEVKEPSRPKISEEQASVVIQSAYRGFLIRRWEPVKKLKQIAKVREKMAELNASIQAMESSSDVLGDGKQRTIIAETIMGLFLELDTIQGLHPSIRKVRKSVVRELVTLQEKLDALINEKSIAPEGQQLAAGCDENPSKETDVICSQSLSETRPDMVEAYPLTQLDGKSPEASEISEQPAEEPKVISENKAPEMESCITDESKTAAESIFVEEEKVSQTEESLVTKGYNESQVLGQDTECFFQQNSSSDGMIDFLANNDEPQPEDIECLFQQNSSSDGMIDSLANGDEPLHEEVSDDYCPSRVGELDQEKQQEGWPTEENSSELNHEDQLGESNNSHVTETKPQFEYMEDEDLSDELGTTKQVEKATETDRLEPDKCFDQSPRSVFTSMFESPEAHDETEHPVIKTSKSEEAYSIMPQEGSPIMEEEEVMLREKEFDVEQEASIESPHTDAAAAILEDERVKSGDDNIIVDQCSEEATCNAFDEEKQPTEGEEQQVSKDVKFAHEVENMPEILSVADGQIIDINMDSGLTMPVKAERGEQLIEENERLKEMVEKLVKSGEEQLRVISSLSGRVKDLEKNLSKKRKVKVKPAHRGKRSGYLKEWIDGVVV